MATRFELVPHHDRLTFNLRTTDGEILLTGLGSSSSKIMVQNEIQHVRSALKDRANLVPHHGKDGSHWVVLKDHDGSVLAKSPHVADVHARQALETRLLEVAGKAPIVDLVKRAAPAH